MADETKQPDPQPEQAGPEQPETPPAPTAPAPPAPAPSPPPAATAPAPRGRRVAALPLVAVGLAGLLLGGVLGAAGTVVVDQLVDRGGYEHPEPARGPWFDDRRDRAPDRP